MYIYIYIYIYISSAAHYSATVLSDYCSVLCYYLWVTFWSLSGHFGSLSAHFDVKFEPNGAPVAKWLLLGSQRGTSQKQSPTRTQTLRIMDTPFLTVSTNSMEKMLQKTAKNKVVFKRLFKALGTWKMKLCTGISEQNHVGVVQKHILAQKRRCHGKGSL